MSKDSLQLVSMSVNPCQGVCEVEHDCATLIIAAEISFIVDVGGSLSPLKRGLFLMGKSQIRNCLSLKPPTYTSA